MEIPEVSKARTKRDEIFQSPTAGTREFEFNKEVAEVFDDMLVRSIPMYLEQQRMIQDLAATFWVPGTDICDLGCSTGTTLVNIARTIPGPCRLIGFDNSLPMLEQARANIRKEHLEEAVSVQYADLNGELDQARLDNASVVTMCWTLQFVRPLHRDRVMQWIYDGLVEGGVLIVTEKILTDNSHMNRFFVDLYYDFKHRNNYSGDEIRRKREALENVLIPYRTAENLELFRRNGFQIAEPFFQWYNFAGYLCVKSPVSGARK